MASEGPPSDEKSDENGSEFEKAMSDVRPLEDRDKQAAPKTLRRRRRAPQQAGEAEGFEIERLGERVEGLARGIDREILLKLRNGEFERDARLDLHGFTARDAREQVRETLTRVRSEGGRCVLVIHGRGRHSNEEPVLKETLPDWLAEPPLGQMVMAFTSAKGGDGGVGATYVLLRRER